MYQVKKRDGTIVQFTIKNIENAIIKAFDASETKYNKDIIELLCLKVTANFQKDIKNNLIEVEDIQDHVEEVLIVAGYFKVSKAYILYRKYREKMRNMQSTINNYKQTINDITNNNIQQTNHNIISLSLNNNPLITPEYILNELYDTQIEKAYTNNQIYLHDISKLTPYTIGLPLYNIISNGIINKETNIPCKPAKNLINLTNQIINYLILINNEKSNIISITSLDTLLAPFIKIENLNYKQIKDILESFIYTLNLLANLNNNPIKTIINLDIIIPKTYQDQYAIIAGNKTNLKYKQCQKETILINQALIEILSIKQKNNQLNYPIINYTITKSTIIKYQELLIDIFKLNINYNNIYYTNPKELPNNKLINSTNSPYSYTDNSGCISIVSINLPNIILNSTDLNSYYNKLDHIINISIQSLNIKRDIINKLYKENILPYTKNFNKNLDKYFSTINIIGTINAYYNAKMITKDNQLQYKTFITDTINHINKELIKYQKKYKYNYNLSNISYDNISNIFQTKDQNLQNINNDIPTNNNYDNTPFYKDNNNDNLLNELSLQNTIQPLFNGNTLTTITIKEIKQKEISMFNIIKTIINDYDIPYIKLTQYNK